MARSWGSPGPRRPVLPKPRNRSAAAPVIRSRIPSGRVSAARPAETAAAAIRNQAKRGWSRSGRSARLVTVKNVNAVSVSAWAEKKMRRG